MNYTDTLVHSDRLGWVSIPDSTCDYCTAEPTGRTHGPDIPYCDRHEADALRDYAQVGEEV